MFFMQKYSLENIYANQWRLVVVEGKAHPGL
jgi:hypothetical protein